MPEWIRARLITENMLDRDQPRGPFSNKAHVRSMADGWIVNPAGAGSVPVMCANFNMKFSLVVELVSLETVIIMIRRIVVAPRQ